MKPNSLLSFVSLCFLLTIGISSEAGAYDEGQLYNLKNNRSCKKCDLQGLDFTSSKKLMELDSADLTGSNLTGAKLMSVDLTEVKLTGARLSEADLSGADLNMASLTGADLTGANLTGASMWKANLTDTNLTGANLTGANLTRANLSGADLTGVRLTSANLTGAEISGVNISGLDLTNVNTTGLLVDGVEVENLAEYLAGNERESAKEKERLAKEAERLAKKREVEKKRLSDEKIRKENIRAANIKERFKDALGYKEIKIGMTPKEVELLRVCVDGFAWHTDMYRPFISCYEKSVDMWFCLRCENNHQGLETARSSTHLYRTASRELGWHQGFYIERKWDNNNEEKPVWIPEYDGYLSIIEIEHGTYGPKAYREIETYMISKYGKFDFRIGAVAWEQFNRGSRNRVFTSFENGQVGIVVERDSFSGAKMYVWYAHPVYAKIWLRENSPGSKLDY